MKDGAKVYFPGLNGLRFLAAAVVVFVHIDPIARMYGFPSPIRVPHPETGKLAVIFFFVLSGFLITYLFLAERRKTGGISVRLFYVRRLLRIWPLYYLLVVVGFFVLPEIGVLERADGLPTITGGLGSNLTLYLAMLPNLAEAVRFVPHFWSIGVEEQFYLLWPVLNKVAKKTTALCLGVIAAYFVIFTVLKLWAPPAWRGYWGNFCIDCMAIGGIFGAQLFHRRQGFLRLMYSRVTQALVYVSLLAIYLTELEVRMILYDIYAVLFAVVILNVSSNPSSFLKLENRVMNGLGKISYGIYVYHPLATALTVVALGASLGERAPVWVSAALVYAVTFAVTIGIAALSYRYIERPFLSLKGRFAKVVSGDEARGELKAGLINGLSSGEIEGEDEDAGGYESGAKDGPSVEGFFEEDSGGEGDQDIDQ